MSSPISHLSAALIKYQVSFFQNKDLCAVAQTSKHFLKLLVLQCAASELLFCVLNINETGRRRIKEILSKLTNSKRIVESQSIILTRVMGIEWHGDGSGREGISSFFYKRDPNLCKRVWKNVSPLEAAAKCGDIYLLRKMLKKVPIKERTLAISQLEGVKATRTIASEPGSFICGLFELHNAYKTYLAVLELHNLKERDYGLKRVIELREFLGDAQKKLSTCLLHAFCNPFRSSGYKYEEVFSRMTTIIWGANYRYFDANKIGKGTGSALASEERHERYMMSYSWCAENSAAERDSKIISELYRVLPVELDKIIELTKNKNSSRCNIM